MPFGIQPIHIVIVVIVALIIFGPRRLPEVGRWVGRSISEIRKGTQEMTATLREEMNKPLDDEPRTIAGPTPPQSADGQHTIAKPTPAQSVPVDRKFCTKCGSPNPADALFCNKCGNPFQPQA